MNKAINIILLFATIFIAIGAIGDSSDAAIDDTFESGDFSYIVIYSGFYDNAVAVTGYTGSSLHMNIPDTVTYESIEYMVLHVDGTFYSNLSNEIVSIHFPKYLEDFSESRFDGFYSLESITVSTENDTFFAHDDALYKIRDDDTLLLMCPQAKVGTHTIHEDTTHIMDYAFENCTKITTVDIPKNVSIVTVSAFNGTDSLNAINVSEDNEKFASADGALYDDVNKTLIKYPLGKTASEYVVMEGTVTIAESTFSNNEYLTEVTLPQSLESIGAYAFSDVPLEQITIPSNVEQIDVGAFYGTDIKEISIPSKVKVLNATFEGCMDLQKVTLSEGVETLENTFERCHALTTITIPASVTSIIGAFSDCTSLEHIDVSNGNTHFMDHEGVLYDDIEKSLVAYPGKKSDRTYTVIAGTETIGSGAFKGNSHIVKVILPEGLKTIEYQAFGYCYNLTDINIPSSVVEMGNNLFDESAIESIVIPDGIEELVGTFRYATSLREVRLSDSVKSLHETFYGCMSLESITIPANVEDITNAFVYCSDLKSITVDENNAKYRSIDGVLFSKDGKELLLYPSNRGESTYTIPDGVTSISNNAFYECHGLREITVPASLTNFSDTDLSQLPDIETIIVEDGNPDFVTINEVLFSADKSILYNYPITKTDSTYQVPDGTVTIDDNAFQNNTYIKSVVLPSSLRTIGDNAFYGCVNLESVTFNEGLESIGGSSFWLCISLKDVEFPQTLTELGTYAFHSCISLTDITIPSGVKDIYGTFSECVGLTSVTMLGVRVSIYAFEGCKNLESLSLPSTMEEFMDMRLVSLKTVTVSENNANYKVVDGVLFSEDGKDLVLYPSALDRKDYTIPEGVETICSYAFTYVNGLETVTFPSTVKEMEEQAFYVCDLLRSVTFNEGFKNMEYAFYGCDSLVSVDIPSGVESLIYAFVDCDALESIDIPASVTYLSDNFLDECHSLRTITVSKDNANYKVVDGVLFSKNGKTLIKYPAMLENTTYDVPSGVNRILDDAFEGVVFLKYVNFPDSLEYIGDNAFENACSLTTVVIPDGAYIGEEAFEDCHALKEVTLGKNVEVDDEAFKYCGNLERITIMDSPHELGTDALYWCESLKEVIVSDDNDLYKLVDGVLFSKDGDSLIRYLENDERTEYVVPEGTMYIGDYAFQYCEALRKITIAGSVTNISDYAIDDCSNLETIVVDSDNRHYKVVDGVLFSEDGKMLVHYPAGLKNEEYSIPEGVEFVYDSAMENPRYLKVLNIPASVEGIYIYNEEYTCFEEINVHPDNRTYRSIDGVLYSRNVTDLLLFPGSKDVSEYTVPRTVTYIVEYALSNCYNVERFLVEDGNGIYFAKDGILYSEDTMIAYPLARTGDIPELPEGITYMDGAIFAGSNIMDYDMPNGLDSVSAYMFQDSGIRTVTLGEDIVYLKHSMFQGCEDLKTVRITAQSDYMVLEMDVFKGCKNVRLVSGIPGYDLAVYYDSEHTKAFDTSDEDFAGAVYLKWTEVSNDTVPMAIGFSIGTVLLIGLIVFMHIRGRN